MGSIRWSMHIRQTAPPEKPPSFFCLCRSALRRPSLSPRTSRSRPTYVWFSRVCLDGSSWRPRNRIDVAGGWFGNDEISSTKHCRSFFVSKKSDRSSASVFARLPMTRPSQPKHHRSFPTSFSLPLVLARTLSSPAKPSGPVTDTCCLLAIRSNDDAKISFILRSTCSFPEGRRRPILTHMFFSVRQQTNIRSINMFKRLSVIPTKWCNTSHSRPDPCPHLPSGTNCSPRTDRLLTLTTRRHVFFGRFLSKKTMPLVVHNFGNLHCSLSSLPLLNPPPFGFPSTYCSAGATGVHYLYQKSHWHRALLRNLHYNKPK